MKKLAIGKISVDRALVLLEKDGIIVNEIQAKEILTFLETMADVVVTQYLRSKRNGSSTNT